MQFLEVLIVFNIIWGNVFGEVGFPELCDTLVQGQPVKFFDQADYVVFVKVALTVNRFLDLDKQRIVVLVTFRHVAYQ